jgi:hypothetical protein
MSEEDSSEHDSDYSSVDELFDIEEYKDDKVLYLETFEGRIKREDYLDATDDDDDDDGCEDKIIAFVLYFKSRKVLLFNIEPDCCEKHYFNIPDESVIMYKSLVELKKTNDTIVEKANHDYIKTTEYTFKLSVSSFKFEHVCVSNGYYDGTLNINNIMQSLPRFYHLEELEDSIKLLVKYVKKFLIVEKYLISKLNNDIVDIIFLCSVL